MSNRAIPIAESVKQVIADYVCKPVDEILLQATVSDLDLDSLDVVQLSIDLEEVLQIDIPTHVLGNWKTVQDVVTYCEQNA